MPACCEGAGVLGKPRLLRQVCCRARLPTSATTYLLPLLLQAFDHISSTASGSGPYAAASPAGFAPPQHNPFAAAPTAEAVRRQLGGMSVGGTGAVVLRLRMLCLP